MSELQVTEQVITASELDVIPGWSHRRPGIRGHVVAIERHPRGTIYSVYPDNGGVTAKYLRDELTPVRKRAGLEQPPDVEERLGNLSKAIASELAGLEASLEHCQNRLRALEQQRDSEQPNPYAAIRDDSGLDVRPAHDISEVPAPPPSDACREIGRLQEELAELRRRDDDWRHRCEGGGELYRRVCQALHVEEDSMPVDELADLVTTLAAEALIASERAGKQGQILSDLREIFGDEAGHGLRQLATRAVLHAEPVLRLLEAHSGAELRRMANGLKWWAADVPAHSVTRAAAEHFAELANLADRDPDGDQS